MVHEDPADRQCHTHGACRPGTGFARLWTATSATRDFRESKWTATPLEPGNTITSPITAVDSGHVAAFAELEYLTDGIPYRLTTTFLEPGLPAKPSHQESR